MKVYEAQENSDLTEGRGRMVTFAIFTNLEEAVKAVKGHGVQGVGDGEVVETDVYERAEDMAENGRLYASRRRVYGYRKRPDGKWDYGYADFRDLHNDPEYSEYMRLKQKFEGKL